MLVQTLYFFKMYKPLFSKKKKKLRPPIQFDCRWPIFLRLRTCTCKQNVALKHFRDSQRSFVGHSDASVNQFWGLG